MTHPLKGSTRRMASALLLLGAGYLRDEPPTVPLPSSSSPPPPPPPFACSDLAGRTVLTEGACKDVRYPENNCSSFYYYNGRRWADPDKDRWRLCVAPSGLEKDVCEGILLTGCWPPPPPPPKACQLAIPARAQTLDPGGRREHWRLLAEQHGLRSLVVERAVGPAELWQYVPAGVLHSLNATLVPKALKQAHKMLGIWATNLRFLASVAASNATAIFIEDDASLQPSFCAGTTAALRHLRSSSPSWTLLFLGHCGGTRVRNCTRIPSPQRGEEGRARCLCRGGA